MVAATIRTIFTQPTAGLVRTQLDTVTDMLGTQFPKVQAMLLAPHGRGAPVPDLPKLGIASRVALRDVLHRRDPV